MTDRTLLDRAGVARKLGMTVETLYRRLAELEADGFPKPVHGRMSGARWDPVAIDRWLDRKLPPELADTANAVRGEPDWDALLDGKAEQIGGATVGRGGHA